MPWTVTCAFAAYYGHLGAVGRENGCRGTVRAFAAFFGPRGAEVGARERLPMGRVDVRVGGEGATSRCCSGRAERLPRGTMRRTRVGGAGRPPRYPEWARESGCRRRGTCEFAARRGYVEAYSASRTRGCSNRRSTGNRRRSERRGRRRPVIGFPQRCMPSCIRTLSFLRFMFPLLHPLLRPRLASLRVPSKIDYVRRDRNQALSSPIFTVHTRFTQGASSSVSPRVPARPQKGSRLTRHDGTQDVDQHGP